jgi:hypothetical protein
MAVTREVATTLSPRDGDGEVLERGPVVASHPAIDPDVFDGTDP